MTSPSTTHRTIVRPDTLRSYVALHVTLLIVDAYHIVLADYWCAGRSCVFVVKKVAGATFLRQDWARNRLFAQTWRDRVIGCCLTQPVSNLIITTFG